MMMEKLRGATSHLMIKIIFVLIILSLALSGIGLYLNVDNSDYVAKVNGYKINKAAFDSDLQRRSSYYSSIPEDERNSFITLLRQSLLNEYISDILFSQYHDKLGIQVSDAQIKETILGMPEFQLDGVFDNATYLEALRRSNFTPDSYAAALRAYLGRGQLTEIFSNSDFTLPIDSQVSLLEQQKRDIYIASIKGQELVPEGEVTDEDILAYYEEHKASMTAPEEVKIDYLYLDRSDINNKIAKITTEEAKAYYDSHPDEFIQPERFKYSSIQVETEDEAKAILEQLKEGADFAKLAKEKSMYAFARDNAGDLGWFFAKDLPEQIKDAGLSKKGQLSSIIPVSDGYVIFRLDDSTKKETISFKLAENDIKSQLRQEMRDKLYEEALHKIQDAVVNSDSLSAGEEIEYVELRHSDWISENSLTYPLNEPEVKNTLFSGELFDENGSTGVNSDVIATESNKAYVIRVVDHKPAGIKLFEQVKESIKNTLMMERAKLIVSDKAEEILAELNNGNTDVLAQYKTGFAARFSLTRDSTQPSQEVVNAVFDMPRSPSGKDVYGYVIDSSNNITFFVITDIKNGTEIKDTSEQTLEMLHTMDVRSLGAGLREEAEIETNFSE